jgi:hypothetical protein
MRTTQKLQAVRTQGFACELRDVQLNYHTARTDTIPRIRKDRNAQNEPFNGLPPVQDVAGSRTPVAELLKVW